MPLIESELVWRPSKLVSDTTPAQNGGAINFTKAIVSGVKNNLFPDVSQSERLLGSTRHRKAFVHINSANQIALQNPRVFLDAISPGKDFFLMYPGTYTDTQDSIATRPYGVAALKAPVASGASSLRLFVEDIDTYSALNPFRAGDVIRIADRPSTGGSGGEEFATIQTVTYLASEVTVQLTAPLENPYAIDGTIVSSVYSPTDVVAAFEAMTTTSKAGTINSAGLVLANKGTAEQHWTLTFTSSTLYRVSGDTVNSGQSLGVGSVTTDFTATNADVSAPYFVVRPTMFVGTFAVGDVVTFTTHPAAIPVWYRREIPPNTASLANDYVSLAVQGESA